MKRFAGVVLILALAACSKQEPPAAVSAAPARNVGGSLPPEKAEPSGHSSFAKASEDKNAPPTLDPAATAALLKQGEEIFSKTCATCHMADGYGVPNLQPQIVGSGWISAADPQPLLSLILRGSAILGEAAKAYENDMAPQDHLSDAEIAAVASYVRTRFAAVPITDPVTPAQVAVARSRPGLPQ